MENLGKPAEPVKDAALRMLHACIASAACLMLCCPISHSQAEHDAADHRTAPRLPPDWAFPVNPSSAPPPPAGSDLIRVPGSEIAFLPDQLTNLYCAPDWHPADHPPMPDVVANGRKPGVYACGFCHLPDGSGRPENSRLAGLPAAYIVQQLVDFRNGTRQAALPTRAPAKLMTAIAVAATDAEIEAAANYFSRLNVPSRIRVVETHAVPHTHVAGWILAVDEDAPRESIGQRIIEVPEDLERFEHRDAHSAFIAYVPIGAPAAGRRLVSGVGPNGILACARCHGTDLHGTGIIPGIAGRSPSYVMRQLFDIQAGLRTGPDVAPMTEVIERLSLLQMVQISAYLATLH